MEISISSFVMWPYFAAASTANARSIAPLIRSLAICAIMRSIGAYPFVDAALAIGGRPRRLAVPFGLPGPRFGNIATGATCRRPLMEPAFHASFIKYGSPPLKPSAPAALSISGHFFPDLRLDFTESSIDDFCLTV